MVLFRSKVQQQGTLLGKKLLIACDCSGAILGPLCVALAVDKASLSALASAVDGNLLNLSEIS